MLQPSLFFSLSETLGFSLSFLSLTLSFLLSPNAFLFFVMSAVSLLLLLYPYPFGLGSSLSSHPLGLFFL